MAGFVPAIHVFVFTSLLRRGARNKCGHDDEVVQKLGQILILG
jgi:hypothetical protein